MNTSNDLPAAGPAVRTNGSGAAAILAAAVGSFALAVLSFAGDKSAAFKSREDLPCVERTEYLPLPGVEVRFSSTYILELNAY